MTPRPTSRSKGFGWSSPQDQVFRNHSVGKTRTRAASGPRLCTVMRMRMSSGLSFAYSTKTSKYRSSSNTCVSRARTQTLPAIVSGWSQQDRCTDTPAADTCRDTSCTNELGLSLHKNNIPWDPPHGYPRFPSARMPVLSKWDRVRSRGQRRSKYIDDGQRCRLAHLRSSGRRVSGHDHGEKIPMQFRGDCSLHVPFPRHARSNMAPTVSNVVYGRRPPRASDAQLLERR